MKVLVSLGLILFLTAACTQDYVHVDRESKIPEDAIKMTPETDNLPPVLHSDEYEEPEPLPYPVNTRGAEDSAFIMPDGNTLYIWFTPDPQVPVEDQIVDGVTGIYVSKKTADGWTQPERVYFQEPGKISLDGCLFIKDDKAWICSAREGYEGMHWVTAKYRDETWQDWKVDDFEPGYEVGELHIYGDELYFHSERTGGKGNHDLWMSKMEDNTWGEPVNIKAVNSEETEGWPFITPDGKELWFTRTYKGMPAIFRSTRTDDSWQEPELILSQFAGEPTLDSQGNIYFTHHFYKDGEMIEADYYIARKR